MNRAFPFKKKAFSWLQRSESTLRHPEAKEDTTESLGEVFGMLNQDLLDIIALVSFVVGVAHYNENLTQNDKADLMNSLDRQTKDILTKVEAALEEQNTMLKEILGRLGNDV